MEKLTSLHMALVAAFPVPGVSNKQVEKQSYPHVNDGEPWRMSFIICGENGLEVRLNIHFKWYMQILY
jgi:hypothetical protein